MHPYKLFQVNMIKSIFVHVERIFFNHRSKMGLGTEHLEVFINPKRSKRQKIAALGSAFEKKLRLVIENEYGRNKDHGFTPLIFHALSDEIKTLRHLRPKLAKNVTF